MDKVLTKSIEQAVDYGHEYVTIEHIALVLIEEKEIQDIFKSLELAVAVVANPKLPEPAHGVPELDP